MDKNLEDSTDMSNEADGTGAAIASLTAHKFVWINSSTSLWYRAA